MRISTFLTLATISCGLAFAADPMTVNYLDGGLARVEPNSWATLDASSDQALAFNSGTETVKIPYSEITKLEEGRTRSFSSTEEPLYKVWTLHKRVFDRTTVQQIDLAYDDETGEPQTMSLEMSRADAKQLLKDVKVRVAPYEALRRHQNWWGNSFWKTNSNKDNWGGAGTLATRE